VSVPNGRVCRICFERTDGVLYEQKLANPALMRVRLNIVSPSMTKRLDGYRGRLKPGQIAEGMNAALENARRLATDADSLLKGKRFQVRSVARNPSDRGSRKGFDLACSVGCPL